LQLTVRDAARFLNVSESTVTRWIKRRGLPAQHVAGQYRFNRALLLEWATANQVAISPEMFDDQEGKDEPVANLAPNSCMIRCSFGPTYLAE
jgi:nitrogen PTS system EIIA component